MLSSFFSSKPEAKLPLVEKLRGFHSLAQDATDIAYKAEQSGDPVKASKTYGTAREACDEGLKLPLQPNGLGPKADNVDLWQTDLRFWKSCIDGRLKLLATGGYQGLQHPFKVTPPGTSPTGASTVMARPTSAISRTNTATRSRTAPPPVSVNRPAAAPARKAQTPPPAPPSAEDNKFKNIVLGEVLDRSPAVSWNDIAGLQNAKQALMEAVILPTIRSDIFQGLRAPVRGILLYGPPGNGKTLLGRALASEAKATFFNISASSLTSKWVGDAEKLVRALFQVAAELQPAIIFIDEVDSVLSARKEGENEAMRRLKTEFLVQFDGVSGGSDRVVVVGATNRPQELDDAVLRRLVKRIYIPLPDGEGRLGIITRLLQGQAVKLDKRDLRSLANATEGYSASDITALCKEAAMGPIREVPADRLSSVSLKDIRPITLTDFGDALQVIKPSSNRAMLAGYEEFTTNFGTR